MCDPITLVGLGLTAAGTTAGVVSSTQEKNAMNSKAEAELTRQQNYAKQGQNVFEQSLSKSTPQAVAGQQGAGAQRALQEYTKLQSNQVPGSANGVGQINAPNQLANTEDAIVRGKVNQQNEAGSVLQGYNASGLQQGIKDERARANLGQIGAFAQGSSNALPLELSQAQNSWSGLSGLGSLLNSAGGLLGIYGATHAPVNGATGGASQAQINALGQGWGPLNNSYATNLGFGNQLQSMLNQPLY